MDKKDGCLEKLGRVKRDRSLLLSFFFLNFSFSLPYGGGIYLLWAYSASIPPETSGLYWSLPVVYLSLFPWTLYYMQAETIFRQATVTRHVQDVLGFTVNKKTLTYKASVFQKDFISHSVVIELFPIRTLTRSPEGLCNSRC